MTETPLTRRVSNVDALNPLDAGVQDDNLPRDGMLRIRPANGKFLCIAQGPLFPLPKSWDDEICLSAFDLFRHVEECRQAWSTEIVEHLEPRVDAVGVAENYVFFQRQWDFVAEPKVWEGQAGKLAVAGDKLFFLLFEDPRHSEIVRRVGATLRAASVADPLTLTITTDVFFVPWGMLYTHPVAGEKLAPDGSNWHKEGFWGYRHILEHNTEYVELDTELRADPSSRIKVSVNVDDAIDGQLKVPCVTPLVAYFQTHSRLDTQVRKTSLDLQRDLSGSNFSDRILFFCCHGRGSRDNGGTSLEPAAIKLSDAKEISDSDLRDWLAGKTSLPSHPFVFINACQGGQMTTLFYQTLAAEFLKLKAVGLVGAQIDIPAVFARVYAERFFGRLLETSSKPVRVGTLMRDLVQEFLDKHHNPLALAYSLYRGADCFVSQS